MDCLSQGQSFLHFEIMKVVAKGGLSYIYLVRDRKLQKRRILKMQRQDAQLQIVKEDGDVLGILDRYGLFPKFYGSETTREYSYVLSGRAGPSLKKIKRALPQQKMSIQTTLRMGLEMLRCIEALHGQGFVHRNIKPGHFLVRASRANPICLIDFALARRCINTKTGEVVPPRESCAFVGSQKYASVNAHERKEQGRCDDLASWWYLMAEMWIGELPWDGCLTRADVLNVKKSEEARASLQLHLPQELMDIWKCIEMYKYDSEPDYALLRSFLIKAMTSRGVRFSDRFDWEEKISTVKKDEISVISLEIPRGERSIVPTDLVPAVVPESIHPKKKKGKSKHRVKRDDEELGEAPPPPIPLE